MSESIVVVLIPACSAIVVALISLLRQLLTDRRRNRAAQVERQLGTNNELLAEYRALLDEHRADAQEARAETDQVRAELVREREAHRVTAADRDHWRIDATKNARRIQLWLEDKALAKRTRPPKTE